MATHESSILCSDRYIYDDGNDEYLGRQFYSPLAGFGHIEDSLGWSGCETKIVFVDMDHATVYRTDEEYVDIDGIDEVQEVIRGAIDLIMSCEQHMPLAA